MYNIFGNGQDMQTQIGNELQQIRSLHISNNRSVSTR